MARKKVLIVGDCYSHRIKIGTIGWINSSTSSSWRLYQGKTGDSFPSHNTVRKSDYIFIGETLKGDKVLLEQLNKFKDMVDYLTKIYETVKVPPSAAVVAKAQAIADTIKAAKAGDDAEVIAQLVIALEK